MRCVPKKANKACYFYNTARKIRNRLLPYTQKIRTSSMIRLSPFRLSRLGSGLPLMPTNYKSYQSKTAFCPIGSAIPTVWALVCLTGCSVADFYAPRAIAYNVEADNARISTSLLNIVRAAYRKPLQFTDISTVTGTANAMGSLNATVPFVGNSGTISPATSLSGGPSFSVANLNTQEFYSGIQTPISKQMIGVFLAQGVRPEVLFPLVISDLTIADGNMTRLVKTDVETPDQFASTYSFILRLVFNGLTVEPTKTASQIGPTLSEPEAKAILRDVLRASAEARSGNQVPALTPNKRLPSGYVLNEETSDFRFCFDPIRSTRAKELYPGSNILGVVERTPYPIVLPLAYANNAPIPDLTVEIPLKYVCGHGEDKSASNVDLKFTLRSLEAMYYYLGSLARIELGLTTGEPTP
jgi:hypothetical protein